MLVFDSEIEEKIRIAEVLAVPTSDEVTFVAV